MDSEVSSSDGTKKRKLSSGEERPPNSRAEDLSAYARITSFQGFKFNKLLYDNRRSKAVFVDGTFEDTGDCAVVLLQKQPILKDNIDELLTHADLALNLKSHPVSESNVVQYACYPPADRDDFRATVIYPATPKHVDKYLHQPMYVCHETAEIYNEIVLPHLLKQKFSIQWVYNILDGKSEADAVLYEDSDPDIGFILLPDPKWNHPERGFVYLLGICRTRSIKSLRDLNESHLPLLKHIKAKGVEVISTKYNIPSEKLRVFIHYQPSYYHFHVHFTSIVKNLPGSQCERAHLLGNVIRNIEMCSSYYQKATLTYSIKENDSLLEKLKEASVIKV